MLRTLFTLLLLSFGAAAMVAEAPQEALVEEMHWQLTRYLGESGDSVSVLPDTTIDIKLSAGELGGSAGCNRYFGNYELEGDQLRFTSPMGSTQMACEPPVTEQEQRYLGLLAQTVSWQSDGDQLTLLDAQGRTILHYEAVEPGPLEGTEWQATGINNGKGGVVSTAHTSLVTAVFSEGTLSGFGGCNSYNATYEIEGDQITFGPAASTRKLCARPEGLMEQEQQLFAALERVRAFSVTPGTLDLRDEDGSLQVSFRTGSP
jgi:heat shock protein HslJ